MWMVWFKVETLMISGIDWCTKEIIKCLKPFDKGYSWEYIKNIKKIFPAMKDLS